MRDRSEPTTLWSALAGGVGDIELMLARFDQGVSAVGVCIALFASYFLSQRLGIGLGGLSLLAFAWFTAAHQLLTERRGVDVLRWLLPVTEVALPAAALWVTAAVQGHAYALGSWVPPQLFSIFIAVQVLRLRPALPVVVSALAAAAYGVFAWQALEHGVPDDLLFRPVTHATRVVALLLTGATGAAAVLGLRAAIDHAGAEVRAHDLFGKYRLGRTIAQGGMGRVVEALYCPEGGFERQVAVKVIHPHLAQDPAFLERFRHEAAIGARLTHPNVVAVLDFGAVDGQYFFAMEYVDGPTLREVLEHCARAGHPMPAPLVLCVGQQVAHALHFAHREATDERGEPLRVIHRDLSPSNVLITRGGVAKLSDFGVARALGEARAHHTGNIAGKPSYLGPEQLRHGVVDERTDLFALAVVLWEMLANRRLFARATEAETLYAVLEEPVPSIAEVRPDLGAHWQAFFARALSRDPAERYPTAAALGAALVALEAHEGSSRAEDLAAWVRAWVDAEELEPDLTAEEPRSD